MDHDRNRRRYGKSDDELSSFFSAAIGVRAQNYDSNGGNTDLNEWHYGLLRAMQRGHMAWFDNVAKTITQLSDEHRKIVTLVYTPHGSPTWLADSLATPWGGGSLVQLAITLDRAHLAARDRTAGTTVLDWLTWRGRKAKDDLLTSLREDGEALRVPALAAYEELRKVRVKAEQAADKKRAEERSEANMRLYSELVGKRAAKELKRINASHERRLRRGRVAA